MKKDLHPKYDFVVFEDTSNGEKFLGKSTKGSKETTTFEGKEYLNSLLCFFVYKSLNNYI